MSDKEDRWIQINALFDEATRLSAEKRLPWLKEACGENEELIDEVLSLLEHDVEQTGSVRESVQSFAAGLGRTVDSRYLGEQVGNFRITEQLAEGGMGTVYLAEHAADDFDRQVAVKLLPKHRLDSDAARRFIDERRILAGLSHPNIARLIDGGALPDGVPYIVMEYIEGMTIDRHCDSNDLDNAAVIDLVLSICDAVQYAHRKLVIHRDIKPNNIIVDQRGTPMLLDFGIAKLLSPDSNEPNLTSAEHRAMTPLYASPEQIEGLPITTACDVYGIGLLLYRLLTRQMPYSLTGTTPREVERAILDQTPAKPSTAVTQIDTGAGQSRSENWVRRQQKELRGELDTIILSSLRKSPDRRYASVAALADDLRRYRGGRPISARGDSPLYVVKKFVTRNPWPVGLATAVIIGALAMTSYYTNKLKLERDTAEQTADFLADLFEGADPYKKNRDGLTVETLLNSGLEQLESDTSLQPLVRARLLTTIAQVQRNLGNNTHAEELAEEAIGLVETHAGDNHAAIMTPLAVMSRIQSTAGNYEYATRLAERMLEIANATSGEESSESAQATHLLFVQALNMGDIDAIGKWATRTYEIRKTIYDDSDMETSTGANALGLYHWRSGDLVKARTYYAESARIQEAQQERNDLNYASLLHNLALLHNDTGDYEGAASIYEESVNIRRAAASERDHVLPLTLYALSHTRTRLGDYPAAYRTFLETIPRQVAVAGPEQHMVAYALTGFGIMLEEIGELDSAFAALSEADRILEAVFDEPHSDQAAVWIGLARLALRSGHHIQGRSLLDAALALRTEQEGPDDYGTLRAYTASGRFEFSRGNYSAAEAALRHALGRFSALGDSQHPFAVEAKTWLGRTLTAKGDVDAAITLLRDAQLVGEEQLRPDHVENVQRRMWLAEALIANSLQTEGDAMLRSSRAELDAIHASWRKTIANLPVPSLEQLLVYSDP